VLAISAGVAEEAVFRGALWRLVDGIGGTVAALAVTSVLFGAAHGLFTRRFAAWSAFALASGLVLGLLRLWTGGLLAPVVGFARIHVAAHLPLDVVGGAALGHLLAMIWNLAVGVETPETTVGVPAGVPDLAGAPGLGSDRRPGSGSSM